MLHPMNDGTLDVLILGPMGAGVAASEQNCVRLKAAVESLLGHAEFTERLRACGYQRFNVTAPEHLQGNRIANEVFRELDKADLVVLDLSSRPGTTAPSPNVMYELALVHALGLPFMLISSDPTWRTARPRMSESASFSSVDSSCRPSEVTRASTSSICCCAVVSRSAGSTVISRLNRPPERAR